MENLRMVTRRDIKEYFREHRIAFSPLETETLAIQNTRTEAYASHSNLDKLLEKFLPGELITICSYPAMGKTALALNIIERAALMHGKTVAFFSLEISRNQAAVRMLCSNAGVDIRKLRKDKLSDDLCKHLSYSMSSLCNAPLYIDDTAAITSTQLRSRCQRLMSERGLDLIVLDYFQLMCEERTGERQELDYSENCRQLKAIAMEFKVPIVVCVQLSRANKNLHNDRPESWALLDADPIGKEADAVLFLHRAVPFITEQSNNSTCEIIIAKQPDGRLETMQFTWNSECARFNDIDVR